MKVKIRNENVCLLYKLDEHGIYDYDELKIKIEDVIWE